jgi:hypothetical protein
MALNLNTIKALFGKLAPMADDVAGVVANYGDDAARLVTNYGDDAARVIANQGDDVARIVANNADDVAKSASLEDLYDSLRGAPLPNEPPRIGSLTDDFGVRTSQPHYEPKIKKSDFAGYSPSLEGTVDYPDGFASPESFAKYYDSLELGYIPKEFRGHDIDEANEMFKALHDKAEVGVIPGNRFWDIEYDPEVYRSILSDTEGPLQDFFAKKSKLNRFSTTPTATPTEVFSNPMFEEDWWL